MARNELHVMPDTTGGWQIVRSDTDEPYGHFNTKNEAIAIATQVSREEQSHLIIHDEHGHVEEEVPPGFYPYSPRVKVD